MDWIKDVLLAIIYAADIALIVYAFLMVRKFRRAADRANRMLDEVQKAMEEE